MAENETTLSAATAAPSEVIIDGKTYIISKITLRDLGHIEQWMRDSLVASGRANIKDPELTDKERQLILREAYAAAAQASLGTDFADSMIESIEGMLRLAWFALRKENMIVIGKTVRKMTLDDAADLLRSREVIESIVDSAASLSGFDLATGDTIGDQQEGSADTSANPPNKSGPTPEQSSAPSPKPTTGAQTESQT